MWWSYNGTNSAARLTAALDLSDLKTATLAFSAWWNTEDESDWFQVLVSDDSGQTWTIVGGPQAAPRGESAPGAHYSGQSTTWINEAVDLSAYAGTRVLVRFEYLTDGHDTLPGVVLDDIGIVELGGLDDVENTGSAWIAEGFLRIPDSIVQNWTVSVVVRDANGSVTVSPVPLDLLNTGRTTISVPEGGRATIVIGAMAPFTSYRADYKLTVQREERAGHS
jgi:bacillopeptidase F (M6 metalloprotease family)